MTQIVRIRSAAENALALVQSEYREYHPLIALARMAHSQKVLDDPKVELEVHKAILPYVAPKLASTEVKVESTEDDRRVVVSLFEQTTLPNGRVVETEVPLITEVSEIVRLD